MKEFMLWLIDGTPIVLKGESYDDLLMEITNFFDIFKEDVCYYMGYSDESVIEKAQENNINIEIGEE